MENEMKVVGLLFSPPGRGEYLRKVIDVPDAGFPISLRSAAGRSPGAVMHFWPSVTAGRATAQYEHPGRFAVDGDHWRIEWFTDAAYAEQVDFDKRFLAGEATFAELISRADVVSEVADA
jgi:hypothetical protein